MFDLKNKTVLITGGAGLLGKMHAEAILEHGGAVIIADCDFEKAEEVASELRKHHEENNVHAIFMDVTNSKSIAEAIRAFPSINVLINNAARNPDVSDNKKLGGHFETLTLTEWRKDIQISMEGNFLCSQAFCNKFVEDGAGNIINIASDLGVIAPDQRIYLDDRKPITYSASKFAIIGMTKYLATYYADKNIRVNCLSPAGVYTNQPADFVERLTNLIPMGRMAKVDDYKGAIVFLCSEGSSYMTGANMIIDGGRTAW
jgi:NAD(P)-dependent dehydrogenase (short-subunit alcohol dehydrogenase family)